MIAERIRNTSCYYYRFGFLLRAQLRLDTQQPGHLITGFVRLSKIAHINNVSQPHSHLLRHLPFAPVLRVNKLYSQSRIAIARNIQLQIDSSALNVMSGLLDLSHQTSSLIVSET
jgi:hypothetical protein